MIEPQVHHLPKRERPAWLPAHCIGYRVWGGAVFRYDATGPVCAWCDTEIAEGEPFALVQVDERLLAVYGHQTCIRGWRKAQKEPA